MASQFKAIFKADKTNTKVLDKVMDAFNIIGTMRPTTNRAQSDIRFYCDNDERWKLFPDHPGAKVPNSKKRPEDQIWWDPINKITLPSNPPGCQEPGVQAEVYNQRVEPSGENANRAAITICNLVFDEVTPLSLQNIVTNKDVPKEIAFMDILNNDISKVVFHEFCHLKQVLDLPGNSDKFSEVYGWDGIMKLDADKSQKQGDSYAFLGALAILNQYGARLSNNPDDAKDGLLRNI